MKNLFVAIATASLLFSTQAVARDRRGDSYNRHHEYSDHPRHRDGGRWVAPLLGGIILGAIITRNNRQYVDEQPRDVYIYREPVPQVTCWDIRNYDIYGNVYYTRECR